MSRRLASATRTPAATVGDLAIVHGLTVTITQLQADITLLRAALELIVIEAWKAAHPDGESSEPPLPVAVTAVARGALIATEPKR
jgi:hypothetical protein